MTTYAQKLLDPRWQRLRAQVLQRDGFTCRDCKCSDRTLHVHHCLYRKGDPWNTEPRFLVTVCDACHQIRTAREGRIKELLATLFAIGDSEQVQTFSETLETCLKDAFTDEQIEDFSCVQDGELIDAEIRLQWDLYEATGDPTVYDRVLEIRSRRRKIEAARTAL